MNNKTVILTVFLLLIAATSSMLALIAAQKITIAHNNNPQIPDFFMTHVVYTELDDNGAIHNQIYATKINHVTANNAYFFENPNMVIFSANEQPWKITANHGKSEQGKEKIFLWDNVKIKQTAGPNNQNLDVATSSLTIYPNNKYAETDQPVTISQSGTIANSIGARADFKSGVVELLSKVKGYSEEK